MQLWCNVAGARESRVSNTQQPRGSHCEYRTREVLAGSTHASKLLLWLGMIIASVICRAGDMTIIIIYHGM